MREDHHLFLTDDNVNNVREQFVMFIVMLFKMIKDFIVHANRSHALGFTCSKEFPEALLIGAHALW